MEQFQLLYEIDVHNIMGILGDMQLYEFCPALEPMRRLTIDLHSRVVELSKHGRCGGCQAKELRESYRHMLQRAMMLLDQAKRENPDEIQKFREFIQARKGVLAHRIVLRDKNGSLAV
jgi:hypothetical protein